MAQGVAADGLEQREDLRAKFQRLVDSVHLYPFLPVTERRAARLDRIAAPKHVSDWEPFLRAPIPSGDESISSTLRWNGGSPPVCSVGRSAGTAVFTVLSIRCGRDRT